MQKIEKYFEEAIKNNASDLHLVGEEKPILRVKGQLNYIEKNPLPNTELENEITKILNPEQLKKFNKNLELDFSYEQSGFRFRINLHRQQGKIGLAARIIPEEIPSPEDLSFEQPLLNLTQLLNGLVLVIGPAGSGKSTTIASMIEEINRTRKAHIITIEDPIEFSFKNKKSLIEQREIGRDTKSFAEALKHVLRQDPDIIMVGEMRDPETISTVLTAAETGHLVFSTLHTATAAETIERIVDVFSGDKQKQILVQLSSVLRGVVAQQLIASSSGTLIPAREILLNNPAIANLIRSNKSSQIYSAIQTGRETGMITMDQAVKNLFEKGLIDSTMASKRSGRNRTV